MRIRPILLACVSASAVIPTSVWAQEEGAVQETGLNEILVTARRTEESSQDVPVAITALNTEALAALDIQNFGDIGKTVPNLDVQRQFGSASAPAFSLRGVSTGSLRFEADAGIGLYIDGVYLGRPAGAAFDIADIERVEVLRGPQGTLFGRNSTGGAINFITPVPSGEFSVKAEGTIGNFDRRRGRISVDLPSVGPLSARVTYLHDENKGYVDNLTPGVEFTFVEPFGTIRSAETFGAENTDALFAAVHLDGGAFTADYKFDFTNKVSTQLGQQLLGYDPTFTAGVGDPPFYTAPPSTFLPPSTERRDELALDFTSPSELEIQGHSLTLAYEVSDAVTLKSISGYRKLDEAVGGNDIDGGAYLFNIGFGALPFTNISSISDRSQKQFSQEVQLLGGVGNFEWVLGGFYFRETGQDNTPVFLGTLFPDTTIVPSDGTGTGNTINIFGVPSDYFAGSNSTVRNKSLAGYAHGTYASEHFELAAGVRYTEDKRRATQLAQALIPFVVPPTTSNAKFDNWDFDATATYIANDSVRAYARFATGYLSGGVLNGVVFQPETMESYELGVKADVINDTLRINAAVFRADRSNVQTLGFSTTTGTFIFSSPEGQETGFELELTAKPNDHFSFNASYGYLDQELSDDPVNGPVNSLAPKHTLYVGTQYDSPELSNGSYISVRLDGFFKDKRLSDAIQNASTLDLTTLPSRFDINARVSLLDIPIGGTNARISAWAQNLTDNDELEFARNLTTNVIGVFQPPRTFGIDFGFEY